MGVVITLNSNSAADTAAMNSAQRLDQLSKPLDRASTGKILNNAGDDPVGMALVDKMIANKTCLAQASINCVQGASVINSLETQVNGLKNSIMSGMADCVKVNSDAVGPDGLELAKIGFNNALGAGGTVANMLNKASFGDTPFFTGGTTGTTPFLVAPAVATLNKVINLSVDSTGANLVDPALIVAANCGGIIDGTAQKIEVTKNAATPANFDITLTLANGQGFGSYVSTNKAGTASQEISLVNAATNSVITIKTGTAVWASPTTVQDSLTAMLGIGTTTPVVFKSGSNLTAAGSPAIVVTPDAVPGIYSLSIIKEDGGAGFSAVLNNGCQGTKAAAATTITAVKGITVTYSVAPAAADNYIFEVKNNKVMQFQTDLSYVYTSKVEIPKVTLDYLNLTGININTPLDVGYAYEKLNIALKKLETLTAQIGALQRKIQTSLESANANIDGFSKNISTLQDAKPEQVSKDLMSGKMAFDVVTLVSGVSLEVQRIALEGLKKVASAA